MVLKKGGTKTEVGISLEKTGTGVNMGRAAGVAEALSCKRRWQHHCLVAK